MGFSPERSVEECLAIVTEVTETCWTVAGREIRDVARCDWPLNVVRDPSEVKHATARAVAIVGSLRRRTITPLKLLYGALITLYNSLV